MVKVGKPAPDFTAAGFYDGKFANFNVSEYKGEMGSVMFLPW
jgi:alkyl hydroperoxide reductase subunit AhpC